MSDGQNNSDVRPCHAEGSNEELLSFTNHTSGQIPPRLAWLLDVDLGQDADVCFHRIMEVSQTIILASQGGWPSDGEWRKLLPSWFLEKTPIISLQEAEALISSTPRDQWHTLPWDLDSWLDAIQVRGWCWWSYLLTGQQLRIYLELQEWPASLEAFEHIINAAGGKINARAAL